jgi:hypothetical protein
MSSTTRARCVATSRDREKLLDPVGPRDEIYVFQALSGG